MTIVPISVIILTYNEEVNIEQCLKSVHPWAQDIHIVDSGSTDGTVALASNYTRNIVQRRFENQAEQLNWAIGNLPLRTDWVLRLDADEQVSPELREELTARIGSLDAGTTGLYIARRVVFMGRWIRHGGYYPTWLLRMWRRGKAVCEQRWMDEHMTLLEGAAGKLTGDIIDDNHRPLHWWIDKHNGYATRELFDLLSQEFGPPAGREVLPSLRGTQEQRKRWFKAGYARLPLFIRPALYFLYRYVLRLGFLDGTEGLIWHFLQGFWYRFLVDAKLYEVRRKCGRDRDATAAYVRSVYGVDLL